MDISGFHASLYRASVDKEGEATITLKIPQSDLDKVMPLMQCTEVLLKVKIEVEQ